jgi:hypothetical protein
MVYILLVCLPLPGTQACLKARQHGRLGESPTFLIKAHKENKMQFSVVLFIVRLSTQRQICIYNDGTSVPVKRTEKQCRRL